MSDITKPHPMLFPVLELMRRECDRMNVAESVPEQIDYMRALMDLHEALKGNERATVLFTPGFTLERGGTYRDGGGIAVLGWHHVLLLSDGSEIHPRDEVGFGYCRWTAKRAALAWMRRALAVSERIAAELDKTLVTP
jgi:hypothetical protein